jgi:hypothetical protein
MGLDKGDDMIRQRLILKLRNVLFNRVVTQAPIEEVLRAWFEDNRAKYDKPEAFDFEQSPVSGPNAEAQARALAAEQGSAEPPDEWQSKRRRYSKRPLSNLVDAFGQEDAARLLQGQDNEWVPVSSRTGWHLSRITARYGRNGRRCLRWRVYGSPFSELADTSVASMPPTPSGRSPARR